MSVLSNSGNQNNAANSIKEIILESDIEREELKGFFPLGIDVLRKPKLTKSQSILICGGTDKNRASLIDAILGYKLFASHPHDTRLILSLDLQSELFHTFSDATDTGWSEWKERVSAKYKTTSDKSGNSNSGERDPLFDQALKFFSQQDVASSSNLQRGLSVGYARAARILDQVCEAGFAEVANTSSPRKVHRDRILAYLADPDKHSPSKESPSIESESEQEHFTAMSYLLTPMITEASKIISALKWACTEINRRRQVFTSFYRIHNINDYNTLPNVEKMPELIIVINTIYELMTYAPNELKKALQELVTSGQAHGVHVIMSIATPPKEILSIFRNKVVFRTSSNESIRLIGNGDAERLAKGDICYMGIDSNQTSCFQAAEIDSSAIQHLSQYLRGSPDNQAQQFNSDNDNYLGNNYDDDHLRFLQENEVLLNKFYEIAARKVSILDEYGQENWQSLEKIKRDCFVRICANYGLREHFIAELIEGARRQQNRLNTSEIISFFGRELRFGLENIDSDVNLAYSLVKLYFFDMENFFRTDYYPKYKKNPTADINFDALSGIDFEVLISQVLQEAGYRVSGTPRTGDQGADVIAEINGKRIIIQAKRYSGVVGNKAVQEVFAAKTFYRGDLAIVVTSSEFSRSAVELAQQNSVVLVGKDNVLKLPEVISTVI